MVPQPDSDPNSTSSPRVGSVLIDVHPAPDEVELQSFSAPSDVSLSSADLARAYDLCSWSSLDLGWRVLLDPNPASARKSFYFNTFTGQTVWKPTQEVSQKRTLENQRSDLLIPGSLQFVPELVSYFATLEIDLRLWSETESYEQDQFLSGHHIHGRTPCLLHILWYSHVLRTEFGLYPPSYLRSASLRRIVLVDSLAYGAQSRRAIPLVETGTLLLDPKMEEVIYVANVLHHELFHAVDCNMIYRARERKSEQTKEKNKQRRRRRRDDEIDFTTPQDPVAALTPLSSFDLDRASRLHGCYDLSWIRLNSPGFSYGSGGASERGKDMFLSHGRGATPVPGFLNPYSQTAVEEDKAEVYATLMRDGRILESSDDILRAKANELRRRLEWFCSDLDASFWSRVRSHSAHPSRPSASHTAGVTAAASPSPSPGGDALPIESAWSERRDHDGHTYFFNTATQQTSWIKPTTHETRVT